MRYLASKSASQIRAEAQAEARRTQARAEQAAREMHRQMERRIDCLTNHGKRALTKAEIERLGREGADLLRRRHR